MAEVAEESVSEVEEVTEVVADSVDDESVEAVAELESVAEDENGEEEVAQAEEIEAVMPPLEPIQFRGIQKNPMVGIFLLLSGGMAFSMGMTKTFYAEATAWMFVIWGALLLFSNMLDNYQTYELTNDGIYIHNPIRFWYRNKSWSWANIYRLDVLVGRRDTHLEHADMHLYHELAGEIIKDREDRKLDPVMAQIIIERAELQPVEESTPKVVTQLPLSQRHSYHWTRSGSLA